MISYELLVILVDVPYIIYSNIYIYIYTHHIYIYTYIHTHRYIYISIISLVTGRYLDFLIFFVALFGAVLVDLARKG